MLKLFSLFLFSLLLIYSCSQYSETPVGNSPNGDIKVQIRVNGIGTVGKRSAITLEKLYVILSGFSSDTIRDSFDLSGMETQTINATFNDLPSNIKSTLYAYTIDSNDKIVHRGSIDFLVSPDQTTIVNLDLSPEYSILFSNFYPIKDSVNRCELIVDFEKIVDTSFQKQTLLGDTVTLSYDYLTASTGGILHNIMMNVYGNINGRDTMMYSGDTTILVTSGSKTQYSMLLKWVGPYIPNPGDLTMYVNIGLCDTTLFKGEIKDTIFVDKSPVAWVGGSSGNSEIFYWNGDSIKQLTNNSEVDRVVKTSGTSVVWLSGNYFDNMIKFYDATISDSVITISTIFPYMTTSLGLSGKSVTWLQEELGSYSDVYFWNGEVVKNISQTPKVSESSPKISGNNVVWLGSLGNSKEIFLWDGNTVQQVSSNIENIKNLNIFGDYITWSGRKNSSYIENVLIWDRINKSIVQVTNNTSDFYISNISISGKNLVWSGGTISSESYHEIYTMQNGTIHQLTNNAQADINPCISGSEIVWQSYDGSDYEIFFWNGSNVIQLTDNSWDDINPQIHGKSFFWQGYDGQDYEIYYYDKYTTYQITDNNYDDTFYNF